MTEPSQPQCSTCQIRLEENRALQQRIADLEAKLAAATKNSRNSSKPPSSDIVNPPKPPPKNKDQKNKRGGQPGHSRHERTPFAPEQVDQTWDYYDTGCPCCGGSLKLIDLEPKVLQQVELETLPIRVEEHRRLAQQCTACQKVHYAAFPEHLVKAGLVGPRLTALVGFLKGACHMSFSCIRKFFRDVIGVRISRGMLGKLIAKVSRSLEDPYQALLDALPHEGRLNVDETGHKDQGQRMWTWCFRAALYTLYKISPSRGSNVLVDVLGQEFAGTLGCDYFSAYRKYIRLNENVLVQFCLAHFIRDVKFLAEHPDPKNRAYGQRLVQHLRELFAVYHRREEYASEKSFRQALARIRVKLVWDTTMESPDTREANNLAERFYLHTREYFRFISDPDADPTNNLAEQAIRFVAIHRRLTQGTRGESGQSWCERIWTAVATCQQQGRSLFEYLVEAVTADFGSHPAPPLVPNTS
jgi:transposase